MKLAAVVRLDLPQDRCLCEAPVREGNNVVCERCLGNLTFCPHCKRPKSGLRTTCDRSECLEGGYMASKARAALRRP